MFNEIQAAMQRLADGYQRNDAITIDEATDALTKMGHQAVALAALPEVKRRAVIMLEWGYTELTGEREFSASEIAEALSLPESVVRLVVAAVIARQHRRAQEDARAHGAALEAYWASVRAATCPTCGATAGARCVTKGGKKRAPHGARSGQVGPRPESCEITGYGY